MSLTSFAESAAEFPRRIVCLSGESAETLYLLGAEDRIVGVSGFSTRPPQVRSKPRVSTFTNADIDAIFALKPDLVLAFSDVQAEITRNLILRGATGSELQSTHHRRNLRHDRSAGAPDRKAE